MPSPTIIPAEAISVRDANELADWLAPGLLRLWPEYELAYDTATGDVQFLRVERGRIAPLVVQ